jgi:hypothetical protein
MNSHVLAGYTLHDIQAAVREVFHIAEQGHPSLLRRSPFEIYFGPKAVAHGENSILMDKRYQVFVSSTYDDLREERQEVIFALLELDCIPSGMELFPAADEDQWTLIKEVIDDCDYYVVIIGGKYGSLHSSGKSFTQMEYEYAVSKQKPTIAFLHETPGNIPADKTEPTDQGKQKLEAFRRLAKTRVVKHWSSPADLGSKVSRSVGQLIKRHPATGWVRANEAVEVAAPEMLRLRERIDELQAQIDKAAQQSPEGSEQLAHGNDKYKVNFDVEFDSNGIVVWESVYWVWASWDAIFRAIAPYMIDRASESEIARILGNSFKTELQEIAEKDADLQPDKWEHSLELSTARVTDEDLKTIIVQLRALGLIARDEQQSTMHWTLTRLGDQTMTRLRAIRKGKRKRAKEKPETAAELEGTPDGK